MVRLLLGGVVLGQTFFGLIMGIGTILVFNGLKIIIVCVRYLLTIWSIVVHRVPKTVLQAITRLIVPVLLAHMVLFVLG